MLFRSDNTAPTTMQKAAANTVKLHTASGIVHEIAATTRKGHERKDGDGDNVASAVMKGLATHHQHLD